MSNSRLHRTLLWGRPAELLPLLSFFARRGFNTISATGRRIQHERIVLYGDSQFRTSAWSAAVCAALNDAPARSPARPTRPAARRFRSSGFRRGCAAAADAAAEQFCIRAGRSTPRVKSARGARPLLQRLSPGDSTPAAARFDLPPGFSHGIAHDLNSRGEAVGEPGTAEPDRSPGGARARRNGRDRFPAARFASGEAYATAINEAGRSSLRLRPTRSTSPVR